MKQFTNISTQALANLIGLKLEGRKGEILKAESMAHFLTSQIRLYVLLHFYANSNDGLIENLPLKTLTMQTGRNIKTIRNSLSMLYNNGYTSFPSYSEDGEVTLNILNITDMYKRRGEGGQGYITCNTDILQHILETKDINSLRVILVGLIKTVVEDLNKSAKSVTRLKITLKEFKKSFPKSARPKDIKKASAASNSFGSMFDRIEPDQPRSITVRLKEALNGKLIKKQIRIDAKNQLQQEIQSLNNTILETNLSISENGYIGAKNIREMLNHNIDLFDLVSVQDQTNPIPVLELPSDVRNDCTVLAQDYGIDSVIDAIHIFYKDYLVPGNFATKKNKSLGGLIRSIIEELFSESNNDQPSLA